MEVFKIDLLGKWRWRMLVEKENLWSSLLETLYGDEGVLTQPQKSVWWKDIQSIDESLAYGNNWFSDSVKLKMGDGRKVNFWRDNWCSPWSLAELFPRLSELSAAKSASVAELGEWIENRWCWRLQWSNRLSMEEADLAENLEDLLKPISPVVDREDKWCWLESSSQIFSVKSAYCRLIDNNDSMVIDVNERKNLKEFWCTAAPSKFMVHGWRV